jgi:hypothetical protein
MSPRPVYWKPKYGTRSSRHRAWARRDLARERAAVQAPSSSLAERLRRLFSR